MNHRPIPPTQAQDRIISLGLLGLVILVYWQAVGCEFITFDDPSYVTANPVVQGGLTWLGVKWALVAAHSSNWHPLTWLSHMVDVELFGSNPAGHHFTNVLLHSANALFLFLALREGTGRRWESALVAALFALHPLRVESVAWVSERKDVLSGLFWMLSMLAYVRYGLAGGRTRYIASLALFAVGLTAKPMLVTLPLVFLLLDVWPLRRIPESRPRLLGLPLPTRALLLEKIPFLALSAASCWVTFTVQKAGKAMFSLQSMPIPTRAANALVSYVAYVGKMLWPLDLSVIYPHPGVDIRLWKAVLAALALSAATVWVLRNTKKHPWALTGWFWYLGALIPVIGLVQVGMQSMADRYTYLPGIGLAIIAVWGGKALFQRLGLRPSIMVLACLVVLTALSFQTRIQLSYWKDTASLFGHSLDVDENNYIAHLILSHRLHDLGDEAGSQEHYKKALALNPGYVANQHNRVGYIMYSAGKLEEARKEFEKALAIYPDYASALINLGTIMARMGEFEAGLSIIDDVLARFPNDPMALDNKRLITEAMRNPESRSGITLPMAVEPAPSSGITQTPEPGSHVQ